MTAADDHVFMARALRLARRGLCDTDPNPAVGCVLVRGGRSVGEGWTQPAGGPHAERVALAAAGDAARGATAYVTLEPCNHQGRTGPCVAALVDAGLNRVVAAVVDPNPFVTGGGAAALAAAGIAVDVGVLEAAAVELNRGYFTRMRTGRPWVRLKVAASLDGRTALADGRSRWITGPAARADVHRWRARSSVILTGIGTVRADDPALTARPAGGDVGVVQPWRAVLDSQLALAPGARIVAGPGRTLVFTTRGACAEADALTAAGVGVETVAADADGRCRLPDVLERLAALGANDVLVEAGPTLNGAFAAGGLIDELIVYQAPQLLGDSARGMFAFAPLATLADRIEFAPTDVRRIGADLRLMLRRRTVAAG